MKKGIETAIPFFVQLARTLPVAPVAVVPAMTPVPVTPTPVPVAPAPMTATPAPVMAVTMPAPVVAVAMPADLFRLQLRGLLAARDGRMSICVASRRAIRAFDRLRS